MRIQSQIEVDRPPNEVFAAMTEVGNTPKWSSAAEREWWVTEPPHGVGSIRHAVGSAFGQRFENDATVTAFDPPRHAALRITIDQGAVDVTFRFEPVNGGARVTVTADLRLRGAARLAAPMFARMYRQLWEGDLATFKRMMEAGEL
jgi:uncharacterized protein YndB with AHSA1/START domain